MARWQAALVAAACGGWIPASAQAMPLADCRVPGYRHAVQCGSIARPLDPAAPGGPSVDIHFVVVPAVARQKGADPVFLIAGGPGQSAIGVMPQVMPVFQRLNNRRDIVFVDQRGTGRSLPLTCADSRTMSLADQTDPARQAGLLIECRDRLSRLPALGGPDGLRHFTTPVAMQDLDAVRAALGAERINLVAASYGTRAALEYLRQFPGRVRRAVLDGVAPPDMALPASQSLDAQSALEALLASCAREAGCQADFPTLRQDWNRLLASLPREVELPHPLTGRPERLHMTRDVLLSVVRGALYSPVLASALPAAVHEGAEGRLQGLVGLGTTWNAPRKGELATGMHFSVICAEDVPRLPRHTGGQGKDFGDAQRQLYERVCSQWPLGAVPEAFYRVGPSPAPVLLLSGGLDPATPPRHATRVAGLLGAKARHVVVDHAGHGLLGVGCLPDVWFRFIDAVEDATALGLDTACAKGIPRPPAWRPLRPDDTALEVQAP